MALVYCKECGREVSDKAKFCPQCGFTFKIKGRGFAISSMVLGIIACTYSLPVLLMTLSLHVDKTIMYYDENLLSAVLMSGTIFLLAALSLIFGILSASKGCKLKKTAAGITLGSVSTVICLICFAVNFVFLTIS